MISIRKKHFLIFLLIGLALIAAVYIWGIKVLPCPVDAANHQAGMDKPDFVDKVWPPPNSKISFVCYNMRRTAAFPPSKGLFEEDRPVIEPSRGVAITVFPEIMMYEFTPSKNPLTVFLYIDGTEYPVEMLIRSARTDSATNEAEYVMLQLTSVYYYFGTRPMLLPGEHEARFVLVKRDGTNLEYKWKFTITL